MTKKRYIVTVLTFLITIFATACSSDEDKTDLYEVLDHLPDNEPSTIEDIVDYPEGPLANKSYKDDMDEMIEAVKGHLPSIGEDEESDEDYLNNWWRVYHYLFAEEYPASGDIYEELKVEPFDHPALKIGRAHV